MKKAVLIQQASDRMRPLLELTACRHAAYCARHGITYWPLIGDVQFSRSAHWNKIVLVQRALEEGFETVVWLDADTLIVRDEFDVSTALQGEAPLGLVKHQAHARGGTTDHFNCGVMVLRNTPRMRAFLDAVWTAGPVGQHRWMEQARILALLEDFPGLVQRLDDRWNSTAGVNEVPEPVIKAWHGQGARAITPIYRELKILSGRDAVASFHRAGFVNEDNVAEQTLEAIAGLPDYPDRFQGRGIVICAGGVGYFTCAWVCIRQLRRLGCRLPIQVWHLGPQEMDDRMRSWLMPLGVECVDADAVCQRGARRRLWCFELKPFAILHSRFREVLFLDADNVPTVNPEFLFDTPEFRATGAVFWPDFQRMKPDSAAWNVFGVPFRDEPEFESGQIVIEKRRSWRPLNLTMWYNDHSEFFYHHVHGDKDTFRFAWHRLEQPFSMPPFPIEPLASTMCQHDFTGRRIFQHRNLDKWNLYRDNKQIPGFLFEDECQNDVRELRKWWDGNVDAGERVNNL